MEITQELLKTIYTRSMEFCNAKFGKEPSELRILDDMTLEASFFEYCRGSESEETEGFTVEDLSSDLDKLYAERKQKEDALRKENEERWNREKAQQARRDKEARQKQYEKLKKEFEP